MTVGGGRDAGGRDAGGTDLFLAGIERALQPLDDPAEIMATVARLVGERLDCDRCAYADVEADGHHFTVTGGHARGVPDVAGRMALADFGAEFRRCMLGGEPFVVADTHTDPRIRPERRDAYQRTGIRALVAVPLHKGGRLVAAMAVHHATPRTWTDAETALLTAVVGRCWETLQRVHALAALRENEERYRLLVEQATDGIWLADEDGRYVEVNPAACELLGYSREQHLRLSIADLVRPAEVPRLAALIARLAAGHTRTEVWDLRRADGTWVPVELSLRAVGRGRYQAIGRDITARRRAEAERERLLARERAAAHRLALLQDATAALSAAATPTQVGEIMVTHLQRLLGVESVAAWELRGDALVGLATQQWPERTRRRWQRIPLDAHNAVAETARNRTRLWLTTAAEWGDRYPDARASMRERGYSGFACLPLVVDGECRGVAVASFTAARTPGPAERAAATTLADQCAQALHRAGLLAAERRARRSAEEFGRLVAALSRASSPGDVVEIMLARAVALGATGAAVLLNRGGRWERAGGFGACGPLPAAFGDDHPLARAVRTGETDWAPDPGAPLALPLPLSDRPIGVIGLWFADGPPELDDDGRAAMRTAAGQCAQALDRARLHETEHEVAEVLQRSLLPAGLPPLARLAGAARYTPATEHGLSGGDWYDMLQVGETTVALVVGDVVGHGPPAAAVMGQLRSVLAAHLVEGSPPAVALERLDRFASRVTGATGSTCACLLYDWSTGELRWALAGHPPVLLVDGPDTRFLGGPAGGAVGTVLGVRHRPPYVEGSTTVSPGASIVLYTDGLVERRGEVLDVGLQRLADAARALSGLGPGELVEALADAALGASGPADDVALLVVRAVPAALEGRLPARGESMRVLRRAAARWSVAAGLPDDLAEDLELALGEAAANAAEHAYRGSGEGEFAYTVARRADGDVDVEVRDHGRWRPVPDDNGHRGHGLRVIGEIADDLRIDRGDDGTRVRFRVPVPARPVAAAAPRRPGERAVGEPAAVRVEGGRLVVSGDVDLAGRDAVAPALLAAARTAGRAAVSCVVDLTGVRYLSSAGVALLAEAAALAGPALSIVVAPGSAPARVCALTGLAGAVPVREVPLQEVPVQEVPAPEAPAVGIG